MKNTVNNKKIKPVLASGFRDFLPQEMIARQQMLDTIRIVFERWGFDPIETSIIQKLEIVTKGEDSFRMNIFKTGVMAGENNKGEIMEEMVLRPELTVGLARLVAAENKLIKPFKVYQTGYVFRGERPQAGRFRGFTQFDADIVGADSLMADAEIVTIIYETMTALGIKDFVIRINNRKILNAVAEILGLDKNEETKKQLFRILDKQDKVGWLAVVKELQEKLSLPKKSLDFIKSLMDLSLSKVADKNFWQELLEKVGSSEEGQTGVQELKAVADNLVNLVPAKNWQINLSTIRGLGYYTGTVLETFLEQLPSMGAVFAGGRYDNLINKFTQTKLPCVGASIGVDRLFAALEKLGQIKKISSRTQVLVADFDPDFKNDYLKISQDLRMAGINTQWYLGQDKSFKAQLSYAANLEIPIVIIMGADEKAEGMITIKDMRARTQEKVTMKKIVEAVKKKLGLV